MTFTTLESSFSQLFKCRDRGKREDHHCWLLVFVQIHTLQIEVADQMLVGDLRDFLEVVVWMGFY